MNALLLCPTLPKDSENTRKSLGNTLETYTDIYLIGARDLDLYSRVLINNQKLRYPTKEYLEKRYHSRSILRAVDDAEGR